VNIAIRLEFQSRGETLITEDIELELSKIRSLLIQKFNVKFRD
jgi:phenylalanyl-tRNA synthetase beta subunit